jgi:hypothetical protein
MEKEKTEEHPSQIIRRQDLVELGDKFTAALLPVATLVQFQQESIHTMERLHAGMEYQARATRMQTMFLWAVMVTAVVVLCLVYNVANKVEEQSLRMGSIQSQLNSTVDKVQLLSRTTKETNDSVSAAEERARTQPTVQLLPELDPEKAKRAPMKLRIETPSEESSPKAPSAPPAGSAGPSTDAHKGATLEIPISTGTL